MPDLTKTCTRCQRSQTLDAFHRNEMGKYGRHTLCRDCLRVYTREWRAKNRDKARAATKRYYRKNRDRLLEEGRHKDRERKYGITRQDYERLLREQGGGCAICGATKDPTRKALSVDHCHTTGAIRGILCNRCNRGLGLFGDDPTILRQAIEYLAPIPNDY